MAEAVWVTRFTVTAPSSEEFRVLRLALEMRGHQVRQSPGVGVRGMNSRTGEGYESYDATATPAELTYVYGLFRDFIGEIGRHPDIVLGSPALIGG